MYIFKKGDFCGLTMGMSIEDHKKLIEEMESPEFFIGLEKWFEIEYEKRKSLEQNL